MAKKNLEGTFWQVQSDGSLELGEPILFPTKDREEYVLNLINGIFERDNWEVVSAEPVSGPNYRVIVKCQEFSFNINLFIYAVRGVS